MALDDMTASHVFEAQLFNTIEEHKPERGDVGEMICPECKTAAPCDVALRAMKQVQTERDARIRTLKRGW